MSKTFLGKGLSFPLEVNTQGNLVSAKYEESVRQSILIILGTAKGERVMRPDFGCGIYDLVFEPRSDSTAGKIAQAIEEALLRFEPRIDVTEVRVLPGKVLDANEKEELAKDDNALEGVKLAEDGDALVVNITYQVRATNNVFNLVYPFYLERSTG